MGENSQVNRLYTVLVAGDVDLNEYDVNKKVPEYIAYKYEDRHKIRESAIDSGNKLLETLIEKNVNTFVTYLISNRVYDIEKMSDEEYFEDITKGMRYDDETGDALTTMNPNWKYTFIKEPTIDTALPLIDYKFNCKVGDLKPYIANEQLINELEQKWDYIMNKSSSLIKEEHINTYGDKETYIKFMSEPMNYNAFVSKETGWLEQGDENQVEWVLNFRERFIKDLPKDTTLKVLNFSKQND